MWEVFFNIDTTPIGYALEIIEDGLCHGFEFMVKNHMIYFREKVTKISNYNYM